MQQKYCFWSVCDGPYAGMMEHCVRTARASGVFKEFHILTDRPLKGCDCYDAYKVDKQCGLFKLHYLKVGMSRLNFEYFAWIDADSVFVRNPIDVLGVLGKSPIHVPLTTNLTCLQKDAEWEGVSLFALRELTSSEGVVNQVYFADSSFWIIHHDAIETVYEVSLRFWHRAKEAGLAIDVSAAIGYAAQMLCANPDIHLLSSSPNVWAGDDCGQFSKRLPDAHAWVCQPRFSDVGIQVRPAIVHVPHSRSLLA